MTEQGADLSENPFCLTSRLITRRAASLNVSPVALVRPPGRSYTGCISSHPQKHSVRLDKAFGQHNAYCEALSSSGYELIRLDPLDTHPDGCFVEDTAVIHDGKALITNLCPQSRKGEELTVARVLEESLRCRAMTPPATLEGGDVIHMPGRLVSGLSQRTTSEGVTQMAQWLNCQVDTIPDPQMIHLKSHTTYIGDNTILSTSRFMHHPVFEEMTVIEVPVKEAYAANALSVGGTVLMSKGHPITVDRVRDAGLDVTVLDMSEFEKCEGALTCLSLLF